MTHRYLINEARASLISTALWLLPSQGHWFGGKTRGWVSAGEEQEAERKICETICEFPANGALLVNFVNVLVSEA